MANLHQLKEKLKQGFYLNNLYEMANLCKDLALGVSSPVPFFVMQHIFLNIARYWEDKPIVVEEARLVELEIAKPLEDLISGIEANASNEQILNLLNRVTTAYLFLFR